MLDLIINFKQKKKKTSLHAQSTYGKIYIISQSLGKNKIIK